MADFSLFSQQTPDSSKVGPSGPVLPQASVPNRIMPAWLLSFLLHGLLLVVLMLLLSRFQQGAGKVDNRSGGIVLVDIQSTTTEYLSEGEVELSVPESATAPSEAAPSAPEIESSLDFPGLESGQGITDGAADAVVDSLPGAENMIVEPSQPGKVGGQTTVEVFGVSGTGSRFVYVFDRSKSMAGFESRPMIAAQQELLQSIESLPRSSQFQIIFYNDQVRIFNPDGRASVYFADDNFKRKAAEFVRAIRPDGGTDHLSALKSAFRLSPDVIFLLTDAEGGFTDDELRQVVRYNRSGAVINTIEFGERRGVDRSLEKVSRTSGGQYVFKNIRTLRIQ